MRMKTLRDSSEIKEAARLIDDLLGVVGALPPPPAAPRRKPPEAPPSVPAEQKNEPSSVEEEEKRDLPFPEGKYRGERLENALATMCRRGGFKGAAVSDAHGLPLAVYNSPVGDDAVAAFTAILGDALARAGEMLEEREANNISLDINYAEKAAIRRFAVDDKFFYLMVICPQEADERSEVELSAREIASIVTHD